MHKPTKSRRSTGRACCVAWCFSVCRALIFIYAVMFFATTLHNCLRLHALKSCIQLYKNLCCKNTTLNIEVNYFRWDGINTTKVVGKFCSLVSHCLECSSMYYLWQKIMAGKSHEEFATPVARYIYIYVCKSLLRPLQPIFLSCIFGLVNWPCRNGKIDKFLEDAWIKTSWVTLYHREDSNKKVCVHSFWSHDLIFQYIEVYYL
jgi:hypothetical protein